MNVVCMGNRTESWELVRKAASLRWPGASYSIAKTRPQLLALVESEDPGLILAFAHAADVPLQDLCSQVRRLTGAALLVVGNSEDEQSPECVRALDAGADDYTAASIGVPELAARLQSAVRRVSGVLETKAEERVPQDA